MKKWFYLLLLTGPLVSAQTNPQALTLTFSKDSLSKIVAYPGKHKILIFVDGLDPSTANPSFTDGRAAANEATPFTTTGSNKQGFSVVPKFYTLLRQKVESVKLGETGSATFTAPVNFTANAGLPVSSTISLTYTFIGSAPEPEATPPTSLTPTGFIVPDALKLNDLMANDTEAAEVFSERLKGFYDIQNDAPFFKDFPKGPLVMTAALTDTDKKSILSSVLSAAGGLDVTTIADGMAQFLVKRTKQELTMAFFNRLREALDNPRLRDFALLFPQTKQALHLIGDEIYNYNAYLNTLRTTFQQDLSTLPPHLLDWVDEGTLAPYFNEEKNRYLKASLQSSVYFYSEISNGTHPGKAIEQYPVSDYLSSLPPINDTKADEMMKGFIELSKSLRSGAKTTRYWITTDSVRMLARSKDGRAVKFYFAMLYTQLKKQNVNFGTTAALSLTALVTKWETDKRITDISQFINQASQVEDALRQAAGHQNRDSLAYEDYFRLLDQFTRTTRAGYKLVFKLLNKPEIPQKAEIVFGVMSDVANVGLDVNRRKYSAAVANVASIYTRLTPDTTPISLTYTVSQTNILTGTESPGSYRQRVVQQLFRYGSFMAAVGEAKTSSEVEAAIEVFALPAGSSSIKRESQFNVSLNAFTGLLGGREIIQGVYTKPWFNSIAVSAPIGVAVSWGQRTLKCNLKSQGRSGHTSVSLFIPLIDLGAVTAFRFTNDSTASLPKITLGNLFAPGLALSVGIGKTPISITGGWQVGPLLRQVTATQNMVADKKYTRWFISLNVDLPLLNLYNRR